MLDNLLKKRLVYIEYASLRIKAQYQRMKMSKKRHMIKSELPKIQRAVRAYLKHVRTYKIKKAVLVI